MKRFISSFGAPRSEEAYQPLPQNNDSPPRTLEEVANELDAVVEKRTALFRQKQTLATVNTDLVNLKKPIDRVAVTLSAEQTGLTQELNPEENAQYLTNVQTSCQKYNALLMKVGQEIDAIKNNDLFANLDLLPDPSLPLPSQHPDENNFKNVISVVSRSMDSLKNTISTINKNLSAQHLALRPTQERLTKEKETLEAESRQRDQSSLAAGSSQTPTNAEGLRNRGARR